MSGFYKTIPAEERLWGPAVAGPFGCVIWTGSTQHHRGYGRMSVGGVPRYTHALAYEELVGPIPDGLVLDHLCRRPACINPFHLEPVTRGENTRRGVGPTAVNAEKTRCVNGHEFTPENTIARPKGRRGCRACGVLTSRRYRAKKRVA